MLATGVDPHTPDFHGKRIWKLATLPKIQIFLWWKCLHHSLPVKSVLARRGIEGLGGYEFCSKDDEDILHALRDCPTAQDFWNAALCPTPLLQSFSADLETWIRVNANCTTHRQKQKTTPRAYFSCLVFGTSGSIVIVKLLSTWQPIQAFSCGLRIKPGNLFIVWLIQRKIGP